ncbi:MAG: HEAT repeat domain-containing protein, partial [Planctomycetaceae bacterium]|nr:HEAT repeat domain-containing protein [Planctomycetaceae bacterium]
DFYNRIIGHYEVPLDHPGRDRFRARIWRVEYVGDGKTPPKAPNLSEADVDRLVNSMNTQNVPTLMRTIDELSDRHGQEAIPALEQAWRTDLTSPQRVGVLWALHRLDALPDDMLLSACESDSEMVRIHAARVIGERSSSSPAVLERAVAMLRDPSALVRRAAALAVGQHPGVNRAYALILADRAEGVLEGDRHLHHAIKIALKGQLQSPSVFEELQQRELTNRDRRLVASVCLALDSPEASSFLMEAVSSLDLSEADLRSACTVIARNVSVEDVESLQQIVRSRFPDDRNLQFELLTAIAAGLRKQGEFAHGKLRGWANDLATAFLDNVSQPLSWPGLPTKPNMDNPWGLERRHSADGQRDTLFLSSLPGGERAVSSLRSVEFELPETLSLFVCGHLGFPQEAAIEKNFVRVCLAIDGRELGRALAPRNDLAQKVTFHLKAVAGQRGYLEIVDGIDVPAYAWIGISRIEPPVVT